MTGSSYNFKQLTPGNLPNIATSIDVWILRGQDILLTKDWEADDQTVSMKFAGFSKQISDTFSETLLPKVQPFNQGLVIIDKIFQFVKMESKSTFEVNSTADLDQVFRTLTQIIGQETNFLSQLKSFKSMLHTSDVFTTSAPITLPTPKKSLVKRNTITNAGVVEASQTRVWRESIRNVRSLADIFRPYSVSSIGDTANKKLFKNEQKLSKCSCDRAKISPSTKNLSTDFRSMNINQKKVARKELCEIRGSIKCRVQQEDVKPQGSGCM
jgi:hypothetical protein